MKKNLLSLAVVAALSTGAYATEPATSSLTESIQQGISHVSLRYRYENVDQDGFSDNAESSSVRLRLNFETKKYNDFSFFVEADHLAEAWGTDFNSLANGDTQHPVIADPLYTEMNQAYVSYNGFDKTTIKYGRQRINLDNQRFIGGVGWRQNEQTYDGFTIVNTSIKDLTLVYANLYNVNTILDKNISAGHHHILNAKYDGSGLGSISGYAYLLENITDTYGLRLTGKQKMGELNWGYEAEFATQETDNTASINTDYYHFSTTLGNNSITGQLGYEVHTADQGVAFQTPLGTNHAFNGWADKFLGTPADGLEDLYVGAIIPAAGMNFKLFYHDFSANKGNTNYGTELDFVAVKKFAKNYAVTFKYASYSADSFSKDTDKLWVMLTADF